MECFSHISRVFQDILAIILLHGFGGSPHSSSNRRSSTDYRDGIHRSTDFLDGIRGIASLIVLITHTTANTHQELFFGFGSGPSGKYYVLQLPFLRLMYGGSSMVAMFFVVSGYVLSFNSLQNARSARWDTMFSQLSSSILRRTARLLFPTMLVSGTTMVFAQLGAFDNYSISSSNIHWPVQAMKSSSIFEQMMIWGKETWVQFRPWTWNSLGPDYMYGLQFWTIAIELRCSMILYLFITATTHLRYRPRQLLSASFQCFCMLSGRWDVALFLYGMFLADIHVQHEETYGGYGPLRGMSDCSHNRYLTSTLLIAGLYLSCNPDLGAKGAPGFALLYHLVPSAYPELEAFRFWLAIGAAMVIYAISHSSSFQKFFHLSVVQYLGKISFSLYLVHALVVSSLGAWTFKLMFYVIGSGENWQYELSWFVMFLVVLVSGICTADLLWRFVDIPVVKMTKMVETAALHESAILESMEMAT
jgi:peptidoglycan/LPS O-acetylase OafA/YrhL